MLLKLTSLFEQTTNVSYPDRPHRQGGWSESWYWQGNAVGDMIDMYRGVTALGLGPMRAALLPKGANIVGQRVQLVDPVGRSQSFNYLFPGDLVREEDIPQMALLSSIPGVGVTNTKKFIMRGIPDLRVDQGEMLFDAGYLGRFVLFVTSLVNWRFRCQDLTQPTLTIQAIDQTGLVTLAANNIYLANDYVQILRTKKIDGTLVGGKFYVDTPGPAFNQFKLRNWIGSATTGGKVRKILYIYPLVDAAKVVPGRIITRRVGRPFSQYRGRRSKRRQPV